MTEADFPAFHERFRKILSSPPVAPLRSAFLRAGQAALPLIPGIPGPSSAASSSPRRGGELRKRCLRPGQSAAPRLDECLPVGQTRADGKGSLEERAGAGKLGLQGRGGGAGGDEQERDCARGLRRCRRSSSTPLPGAGRWAGRFALLLLLPCASQPLAGGAGEGRAVAAPASTDCADRQPPARLPFSGAAGLRRLEPPAPAGPPWQEAGSDHGGLWAPAPRKAKALAVAKRGSCHKRSKLAEMARRPCPSLLEARGQAQHSRPPLDHLISAATNWSASSLLAPTVPWPAATAGALAAGVTRG